jgi:twitching motility protein PilT
MDLQEFNNILRAGLKTRASDIIFIPGQKPTLRAFDNFIEYHMKGVLTEEDTNWIAEHVMKGRGADWGTFTETEVSFEEKLLGRFRVSICQSRYQKVLVIRVIPTEIYNFRELNLPEQILDLANLERGLVLVTGATGEGKSTTISTLIQQINQNRKAFILTIEDPIEFIYQSDQSLIVQREIGEDSTSYKKAINHGLRQHPNIIFVGEIRDAETFEAVLTAAETGHLVFSTMHTTNVITTINRIFSFYPEAEREALRIRLSSSLAAILTLRLLKRKIPTSEGTIPKLCLIPACELMTVSSTISECLKVHEKFPEIEKNIEKEGNDLLQGIRAKSFNFDQYISKLLREGHIELETAKAAATKSTEVNRQDILEGNQVPVLDPYEPIIKPQRR